MSKLLLTLYAGVAQWQRNALVMRRLWVRLPPPAPGLIASALKGSGTAPAISIHLLS